MSFYRSIRDWVDRQWRAPGVQWKVLSLPAILPLLVILIIGKTRDLAIVGWAWFIAWNVFVLWRMWLYLKEESASADAHYDDAGKFRLSKEYHDTESATAARKRRRRR